MEKMTNEKALNQLIKNSVPCDTNLISDGFHTFKELYDHRIVLFIQLAKLITIVPKNLLIHEDNDNQVWYSKYHSDGSEWTGWFILGIGKKWGDQITYHLPDEYWDEVANFAELLPKAPAWDGHTSSEVLDRLKLGF